MNLRVLLKLVSLCTCRLFKNAIGAADVKQQRIQIETMSRDYRSGPVDGVYMTTTHDLMLLTIEDVGQASNDSIWQWSMMTSEETGAIPCELSKIYNRGESAAMICKQSEGEYYAFAKLVKIDELTNDPRHALEVYFYMGEGQCTSDGHCLFAFEIGSGALSRMDSSKRFSKAKDGSVMSDPVKVVAGQYCFLWAYKIDEIERGYNYQDPVGYVSTQPEPMDPIEGSYIKYRLRMWITEANAMTQAEIDHQFPQSEYSGVLTTRFKNTGLEPCIRYAHQAIEVEEAVPMFLLDPMGDGVFWTLDLKAHTNTVRATLSDLSFTIASRQHIGLYGCFVAETRVLLDTRQFSFMKAQKTEVSHINLANSRLPSVLKEFLVSQLKHIQGNYVRYVGRPWDYEDPAHRKDMQLFQNPCMTLEFVFAVRGLAYITQNWLSRRNEDISQVALPGIGSEMHYSMTKVSPQDDKNQTKPTTSVTMYTRIYDFAFTSMHLVLLTADSHVFLHPTSIIYEGFGLIRETQSYRVGALVNRRWCADTGTPREHNMIVPAFSAHGNVVIIQIVPGDETKTMRIQSPSHACAQPKQSLQEKSKMKKGKKSEEEEEEKRRGKADLMDRLEYCIHWREVPKGRSKIDEVSVDEEEKKRERCKELVQIPESEEENSKEETDRTRDSLLAYWMSGPILLDALDPHFVADEGEDDDAEPGAESANRNSHVLYEADRKGKKLSQVVGSLLIRPPNSQSVMLPMMLTAMANIGHQAFRENGLEVASIKMTVGRKAQLWLHDVQFTAVERQYLLAAEIKSESVKSADFAMAMLNLMILDQPVRLMRANGTQMLETEILFSGVLIVRPVDVGGGGTTSSRLHGTVKTFTINTALNSFVLHLDYWKGGKSQDLLLYSTFDGSHARPLGYLPSAKSKLSDVKIRFTEKHPKISGDEGMLKPDVIVSQHGLISVLLRKANQSDSARGVEERDDYPQGVIIGSTAVVEPLRKVMPFKGTSYVFQRLTTDGEIIFGDYRLESWTKGPPSDNSGVPPQDFIAKNVDIESTKFLATPFESVLRGTVDAGDEKKGDEDDANLELTTICPFSDFKVHYQRFDFAEVEYQTRITAETIYLGSTIPLEADVLVEFDDHHGVSVTIHSAIEENRDQTLVRKTIDIHTFLTPADLEEMYHYHETHEDGDPIKEDITIFSLTIRPSIINARCRSEDLFKTISINVGCNPFTSMRFIPEAVGLRKIPFIRSNKYSDRESQWTVMKHGEEYEVTIPRRKINYAQRHLFKCKTETSDKRGYCTIPSHLTKLFKENIYGIHFTKSIVPKFEQRLSRHMRRVTGNVFLYNILGGEMYTNTSLLDSKCHNLAPPCAPTDTACSIGLNETEIEKLQKRPWTTNFFEHVHELNHHTDIYRHYRDCFSKYRLTTDREMVKIHRGLPLRMSTELYWIFNSTNFNALSFNKHRNFIFLLRAVVLNTPDNGFTYCQQLETFFLLQMTGVAPARQPLPWHFYLGLITFVLFIFVLVYFYFARSSRWQSEVSSRRIREEEEKEQREADAKNLEQHDPNSDAFAKWAGNLRALALQREKGKEVDSSKAFNLSHHVSRTDGVDHSGDKAQETHPT